MLSYDSSAMEFVSGEPDVSGGNGAIRVIGRGAEESSVGQIFVLTLAIRN